MHSLSPAVELLIRTVAQDVVMPRFRNLRAEDISEKASDDLVTIADRESEEQLCDGLLSLLPEAGLIGEEACAADPALLARVGQGLTWIIDPIDGTGNFATGNPPFAIMVALADGTRTEAGWIYDPLNNRMCHAADGKGAYINGERVQARTTGQSLPVAGLTTLLLAPDERARLNARAEGRMTIAAIPRCAGEQYPRIVLGENDLAVYERTLPWDHAPGALFLEEAGGRAARTDGAPYQIGDLRRGLLAAASPAMWDKAAAILYGVTD